MSDIASIASSSGTATSSGGTTAYTLRISERTILSGSALSGHVQIDVAAARQDGIHSITVRLRGTSQTYAPTNYPCQGNADSSRTHDETHTSSGSFYSLIASMDGRSPPSQQTSDFLKLDLPLWSFHTSPPPLPPSRTVNLPFTLAVPPTSPPTFASGTQGRGASISYIVEALGARKGLFKSARRISAPVVVVPVGAAEVKARLLSAATEGEWPGAWRKLEASGKGKRGARVELKLPELASYPSATPIPYALRVVTMSAGRADDSPPVPSLTQRELTNIILRLERTLSVKAAGARDAVIDLAVPVGGLGEDAGRARVVRESSMRWVAERSVWETEEVFRGRVVLQGTPSFGTDHVSCSYVLYLRIADEVKASFPIVVDSGVGGFVDAPPAWSPPAESLSHTTKTSVEERKHMHPDG